MNEYVGKTVISYYRSCRDATPREISLSNTLSVIKSGRYKDLVERIRTSHTKEEKEKYKRNLPAVTFGGKFSGRTQLVKASQLACLDFDKVNSKADYYYSLKGSEYIFSFWLSPSGNGFKALVRIPEVSNKEEYQEYYKAILKHFKGLEPDEATKDITRLCFLSYDPNLYLNREAKIFTDREQQEFKTFTTKESIPVDANLPEGQIVDRLLRWWMKNYNFTNGARNNSLFILACSFSNFGVNKSTTEDLFYSFEDKDFPYSEIQSLINSAYKKADFNTKTFPR